MKIISLNGNWSNRLYGGPESMLDRAFTQIRRLNELYGQSIFFLSDEPEIIKKAGHNLIKCNIPDENEKVLYLNLVSVPFLRDETILEIIDYANKALPFIVKTNTDWSAKLSGDNPIDWKPNSLEDSELLSVNTESQWNLMRSIVEGRIFLRQVRPYYREMGV